jgi:hypothetical protein
MRYDFRCPAGASKFESNQDRALLRSIVSANHPQVKLKMENPPFDKRQAYLALAICFAIIAIYNFVDPPLSRPAGGRWSGFFAAIWDIFGANGIQGYWLLCAATFFACYLGDKK